MRQEEERGHVLRRSCEGGREMERKRRREEGIKRDRSGEEVKNDTHLVVALP